MAAAWKEIPESMVRKSFTSTGLIPMTDWTDQVHTRLKTLLSPDAPVIIDADGSDNSDCDDLLQEGGLLSDYETDNGNICYM